MSVSFCLPHPVAVSVFIICSGLCACIQILRMWVLYVSFGSKVRPRTGSKVRPRTGSKVRPRTFGCVTMGSAVLFILRSRLLIYSAGSVVNRVQVVLFGLSVRLFCLD